MDFGVHKEGIGFTVSGVEIDGWIILKFGFVGRGG